MSFRFIGLSFSSLLLSPIILFVAFHYFHIFISILVFIIGRYTSYFLHLECWFVTYWCIKGSRITLFIPSFGIDSEILAWEVVSWDRVSCVHQWFERVYSFLVISHWSMIYWWPGYEHIKKKQTNKQKQQKKMKW